MSGYNVPDPSQAQGFMTRKTPPPPEGEQDQDWLESWSCPKD